MDYYSSVSLQVTFSPLSQESEFGCLIMQILSYEFYCLPAWKNNLL